MIDHPFNPRQLLNTGDPVTVQRFRMVAGVGVIDEEIAATVVSNSDAAVTVAYADGTHEVIEWRSGRVRSAK